MGFVTPLIRTRQRFYLWRDGLGIVARLTMALGMASLVGLLAQVRLPLPFTPVPVTAQTLGVLLAGVILGSRWGGVSLAIYLVMGLAGFPWFSGLGMGLGPTGGYLIGFVLAAVLVGFLTERRGGQRPGRLVVIMLAGSAVIYLPGVIWLYVWLGGSMSLGSLMAMGVVPFLGGDVVKSLLAVGAARVIGPVERACED